jgi:hypothetical protein
MTMDVRRQHRSWRVPRSRSFLDAGTGRAIRPELFLIAVAAVGMLLVDVWQSSRMTELCLSLEKSRAAVQHAQARLDVTRARLERQTTRAELVPLASELGLAPADARQVVQLPSEYLAGATDAPAEGKVSTAMAWAERVARALVPDATARARDRTPVDTR